MRIGVFGGTFDPPHIAHLILADECRHQLELDRVLWVLTQTPPHKLGQVISPLEQRLALLQAALAGEGAFQISRADIDRPAPHYAVDTLRILRTENPTDSLVYLMGGLAAARGQLEQAEFYFQRSAGLFAQSGDRLQRGRALLRVAEAAFSRGALDEAVEWLEDAGNELGNSPAPQDHLAVAVLDKKLAK